MFSHTVTGFFLLCGLDDNDGNGPCGSIPALPTPWTCWCCRALVQPPAPCSGAEAALRAGKEGQGTLRSFLMSMELLE